MAKFTTCTMGWGGSFLNCFNILTETRSGALSRTLSQENFIERSIQYHPGCLQRRFESSLADGNMGDYMNGTHFIINVDSQKRLLFLEAPA